VRIGQIRELALSVSIDGVQPGVSPGEPTKYQVTVKKETDPNPRPDTRTISMANPRLNIFELIGVQGSTNEPTALVIKLKEDFDTITVARDKPYVRVIGHAADLSYPPGKQTWSNKKVNETIKLDDDPETYKIVAITRSEVVLSADSNKRRTIIKYNTSSPK
jgi:hypothetical protein